MRKLLSRRIAAMLPATLIVATTFGPGCARHTSFVFPMHITGSVVDAAGSALSDVTLTFESETIPYPREPLFEHSMDGTIDVEYLLAFGRKQHRGLRGYKGPEDSCRIVLTREGYVPAVFEFKLSELEGECEHPIDLGSVVLECDRGSFRVQDIAPASTSLPYIHGDRPAH